MNQHRITEIERRLTAIEKIVDESKRNPETSKALWSEIMATAVLHGASEPGELADAIIELLEERGFV